MDNRPDEPQPAMCQSCGVQPAAVEFIQVNANERRQIALCRECAATFGVEGQLDAFQRLAQLLMHQMRSVTQVPEEWQTAMAAVCSRCGLVFEQFLRTGLLGCPQCYKDFHDFLTPVLRRLHGVTKQTVDESKSVPETPDHPAPDDARRARLEAELHLALVEENFERAATIRDELKRL